jgi:copper(I)-binding protein
MCGSSLARRFARAAFGIVLMLVAAQAQAIFIVNQPWVSPAARGRSTEAYMDLTSTEGATLVGIASDIAVAAVILGPGKIAKEATSVALPERALVALKPGGYRIALKRVVRTLKVGDRVMLTLTIQAVDGTQQQIPVDAEVRLRSPIEDERVHKHAH